MNDQWGYDPENTRMKYGGFDPNLADTGGGYTPSYNFINPKTGVVDPNYRPPPGTTDSLGQSGTPGAHAAPGGGGGAPTSGFGGGGPASPATTATTAATTGGATTGAAAAGTGTATTYLGMTVPQWLQSAMALYGVYKNSQPGKFQQIPEDPSQTAARQRLLGFVDHSPTRDLLGNLIGQRLGAAHPFELPKSPTGYNPFPSGNPPSYDLSAILPMLMHGGGSTATPASDSTGVAGQWLDAHPEVLKMGVNVAAGALSSQFGIPPDQALQIVTAHLQSPQPQIPMMGGVTAP